MFNEKEEKLYFEKAKLCNLGHWLGLITNDKELPFDLEQLLRECNGNSFYQNQFVLPIVLAVLRICEESKVSYWIFPKTL